MTAVLPRWTIVADDLTGAADAAATFGPTLTSTVLLDVRASWPEAEILAVNTESRYLPAAEAVEAVCHAVSASLAKDRRVYKKIDSLLRGNPGLETAAALSVLGGKSLAVVAPAFPGTGRTTVGGVVHVAGVPHSAGHFGGNVAEALAAGELDAAVLPRPAAGAAQDLAASLLQLARGGVRAVVVDAVSDEDLETIARAGDLLDVPTLLVGSGGLSSHLLPSDHGSSAGARWLTLPEDGRSVRRGLTIVGSYSTLATVQLAALTAAGAAHIVLDHSRLDALPDGLADAMAAGDVVVSPDPAEPVLKTRAAAVARALATAALAGLDNCDVLLVSGGETARAILDGLGARSMTVLGELEPGVVVNTLPGVDQYFITKAGAFGDENTLARTLRNMKSSRPASSPTTSEHPNEMSTT
jgi:uncharacterized protein YgbK (DUF1537 family)